jgi:SsrA-binding protein
VAKGKGKRKVSAGDVATNRQAAFRFHLQDRVEAGLVLRGTEVKSLRTGTATLKDAYASIQQGEVWLHNAHIPPYPAAFRDNHEPERPRSCCCTGREIERLQAATREKGLTVVPDAPVLQGARAPRSSWRSAKGKDRFDKRESIKQRDMARDVQRELRDVGR